MNIKPSVKLSINNPCDENWEKMAPENKGRFCTQCSFTVVDFTKMTDKEIQNYFLKNREKKTCGRITPDQMKRTHNSKSTHWESFKTTIELLFSRPGFKTVVLSAFALLTFLPSCRRHSMPPKIGLIKSSNNFPIEQRDNLKTAIVFPISDTLNLIPEKRIPDYLLGDLKMEE